jgi:hypothetical protein
MQRHPESSNANVNPEIPPAPKPAPLPTPTQKPKWYLDSKKIMGYYEKKLLAKRLSNKTSTPKSEHKIQIFRYKRFLGSYDFSHFMKTKTSGQVTVDSVEFVVGKLSEY